MKQSLSPRELAEALDVSESSLKRWADEGLVQVERTAGGHRRIALAEAIRYVRKSGMTIIDPGVFGIADLDSVPREQLFDPSAADPLLVDAVMNGQANRARGLVLSMYLGGRSVSEICDGPLTRAMHAVGDLWKHSDAGILVEHRATEIVNQALHQLRAMLPQATENGLIATGGAPRNDPYMITSLMAAIVLSADGWRERNLGGEVPLDLIAESACENGAALVWLSVSVEQPAEVLVPQILALGNKLKAHSIPLALGGRMLPPKTMLVAENIHLLGNMTELTTFARGVVFDKNKPPNGHTTEPAGA